MNGIDKLWSFEVEGSKWPNRQDHTLRELKEADIVVVRWVPGPPNEANIFTKNLSWPMYKNFVRTLIRKDECTPATE